MNLDNLFKLAKDAANQAGFFLNNNKNVTKQIITDEGRDIKLALDRKTEELINNILKKSDIPIMGEELSSNISSDYFWVVDPIDGTANYFRGLDQCCISIALLDGSDALIGIVYNFNTNEIYSAVNGQGAFLNDVQISVSNIKSRNKASLTTGFPASESVESSMEFLEGLKQWKKIRMFGSAALSCAYVASGKCDFYAEKGVYLWDFAAGICLVEEAGGKVEYKAIDDQRYSVKFSNNLL